MCGGFDPTRTIPVIIDAGCFDKDGNSAKLDIRGDPLYTGLKQDRVTHTSEAKTVVNSAYYGSNSFIGEFMAAATALFGTECLLQFEDFNSNDAFPLLAAHRDTYLTYNDDIQVGSSGWWCWWLSGGGGSTANTPSPTTPSRVPPPWPSLRSSEVTRSRIEPLRLPCTPYPYTP